MLNLVQLNRNIRSIRRYRQIGSVLFKYGFDQLLEYLNLSHFIARGKRIFRRSELKIAQLSPAERMRLALEELGPSFVKLGQLLSTRPDVLPQSYITEFAKLQDMVPSFSFERYATRSAPNSAGKSRSYSLALKRTRLQPPPLLRFTEPAWPPARRW